MAREEALRHNKWRENSTDGICLVAPKDSQIYASIYLTLKVNNISPKACEAKAGRPQGVNNKSLPTATSVE